MKRLKWLTVLLVATVGGCGAGKQKPPANATGQKSASQTNAGQTNKAPATAKDAKAADNSTAATNTGGTSAATGQPAKKGGDGKLDEFKDNKTGTPGRSRGVHKSRIKPTRTKAALKFTVIDRKKKKPIRGIVIVLTDPKGRSFFTDETDRMGYTEILVPVGVTYKVIWLTLGRKRIAARLPVENKPALTMRLTLRYRRFDKKTKRGKPIPQKFVLKGVEFDTGKARIRKGSFKRLDQVVEYMSHKKSSRIRISGHTDNVGKAKTNKALSLRRAKACRAYLIKKGIAGSRIEAVGYGSEQPIASNSTKAGRQRNRRIEAMEL